MQGWLRSATLRTTVLLVSFATGCDRGNRPEHLNRPAPLFTVSDTTSTIDLAKLRGKVVVLNLWASTCAPCVEELPSLLDLKQRMPEIAIVGVSMDQDDTAYRRFLTQHHVGFVTVRDESQRINALYGTVQIPETYVIDRAGVLRRKFVSAQQWTSPEIIRYLEHLENS